MHRPAPRPIRLTRAVVRALVAIGLGFLGLVALIYFKQHSMIYHPRPYDASYAQVLPANLPLTLVNHPTGPHAFDLFDDSAAARGIIRQMLAFLRAHLLP